MDDTDSPRGGCTTFVLSELLGLARERGVDLVGAPRLVRLNPNIPWKTRGNGALSAQFAHGIGPRRRLAELDGRPVWSYDRGTPLRAREGADLASAAWDRVLELAPAAEPGTDPALVAVGRPLPAALYWEAVRGVVPIERVRVALHARGARYWTRESERGIVGAAASIAWPGRRATWEVLAYREPAAIGTSRKVDVRSVRAAQRRHPSLFLCHDPRTRRMMVAPHTACPILFGLRGTRPSAVLCARREIRSEPVERWVLFRTNQATGDHLARRTAASWPLYSGGRLRGTVRGPVVSVPGGHVGFSVTDAEGARVACLAFEPTKTLPRVARALRDGDRVQVWGGRGGDPTVRLEGIVVERLAPGAPLSEPPRCAACQRTAGSLGRMRGFRCPGCHRRWPPEAARRRARPRSLPLGRYDPTASARRHLAPLGPEPGVRPGAAESF